MTIRVVDMNGVSRDWIWVQNTYGPVGINPTPGDGFKVVQLTEIEGPMMFTCTVLNSAGGAVAGQQVAYMWPGGEAIEITDGSGKAEHTAGSGEGYSPPNQGPISWEVRGAASERIDGIGWLYGTNHRHLQVMMQWNGGEEPPPEDGDIAAAINHLADVFAAGITVRLTLG